MVRANELARRIGQALAIAWIALLAPFILAFCAMLMLGALALRFMVRVMPRLLWLHFRSVRRVLALWPTVSRNSDKGSEPAQTMYVHGFGPVALRVLWSEFGDTCDKEMAGLFKNDWKLFVVKGKTRRPVALAADHTIAYVVGVYMAFWALAAIVAAALLIGPAVLALVLASMVLSALVAVFGAGARAIDAVARRLAHTATVCPHPDCGRFVALPVRHCPDCRQPHRRLVPGRFGVVRRICHCGKRLPAGVVFGANRLEAHCPHCSRRMPSGRSPARLVLVAGAPGSGRSSTVRSGLAHLAAYVGPLGGGIGGRISGTGCVQVFGLRGGRRSLVVLDPPGPEFADQAGIAKLDGLRHAHGVVLVIDVLALSDVRRALTDEDRERIRSVSPASQDPVQAAERVLRTIVALPARRRPKRIAVVLTKTAALGHTSLGTEFEACGPDARGRLEMAGAGNLLRVLDHDGLQTRFLVEGSSPEQAAELSGLFLWASGIPAAPHRLPRLPKPRLRLNLRLPRVALNRRTTHRGRRPVRYSLLISHIAGFVSLPLLFGLLFGGGLPSTALFGVPSAVDRWQHPLSDSGQDIDLAQNHPGSSWPAFSASFSAPGSSPAGPRAGITGYWATDGSPASTSGSPGAADWLDVDFGVPVPISWAAIDLGSPGPTTISVQVPDGSGGWLVPAGERDTADRSELDLGLHDVRLGVTASAIRIVVPGATKNFMLVNLNVWSRSSSFLRFSAAGSTSRFTNTSNRAVTVQILPPMLPPGWRAEPAGALPRRIGAHSTVSVPWHFTAASGAGPGAMSYAVHITDAGHSVTQTCVAMLRMAASGPTVSPITCG